MSRDITANAITASQAGLGYGLVLMSLLDYESGVVRVHSGAGTVKWDGLGRNPRPVSLGTIRDGRLISTRDASRHARPPTQRAPPQPHAHVAQRPEYRARSTRGDGRGG